MAPRPCDERHQESCRLNTVEWDHSPNRQRDLCRGKYSHGPIWINSEGRNSGVSVLYQKPSCYIAILQSPWSLGKSHLHPGPEMQLRSHSFDQISFSKADFQEKKQSIKMSLWKQPCFASGKEPSLVIITVSMVFLHFKWGQMSCSPPLLHVAFQVLSRSNKFSSATPFGTCKIIVIRNTVDGAWIWLWGGTVLRDLPAINLQLTSSRDLGGGCWGPQWRVAPQSWEVVIRIPGYGGQSSSWLKFLLCTTGRAIQLWGRHCWEPGHVPDTKKGPRNDGLPVPLSLLLQVYLSDQQVTSPCFENTTAFKTPFLGVLPLLYI